MNLNRAARSLIAWVLYICILFSALACSIGHGQMAGLQLSGISGLYCSTDGSAGADLEAGLVSPVGVAGVLGCAIGAALSLGLALLFCLSWLRRPAGCPRPARERRGKAPPRYSWPSANPRASPFLA